MMVSAFTKATIDRWWEQRFEEISATILALLIAVLPIAHTTSIRAACLLILLALWIFDMFRFHRFPRARTPYDPYILIFVAFTFTSLFTAIDWRYSLEEVKGDVLQPLLLFFLVVNLIRTRRGAERILWFFLMANVVMVTTGIGQYFYEHYVVHVEGFRARSLHSGAATYGTYLILFSPFLPYFFQLIPRSWPRWSLWLLTGFNCLSLYQTHTRGVWVGFGLEVFLLLVFLRSKRLVLVVLAGLLCWLLLVPRAAYFHKEEISGSLNPIEWGGSTQERIVTMGKALAGIKESPLTGVGYGKRAFRKKYPEFAEAHSLMDHAHNTFLNLALELGLPGLAVFLALLLRILLENWRAVRLCSHYPEAESTRLFCIGLLVSILGFMAGNQFDDFYLRDLAWLFWFLVAIGWVLWRGEKVRFGGRRGSASTDS
jgi:O-antigen ligase